MQVGTDDPLDAFCEDNPDADECRCGFCHACRARSAVSPNSSAVASNLSAEGTHTAVGCGCRVYED